MMKVTFEYSLFRDRSNIILNWMIFHSRSSELSRLHYLPLPLGGGGGVARIFIGPLSIGVGKVVWSTNKCGAMQTAI